MSKERLDEICKSAEKYQRGLRAELPLYEDKEVIDIIEEIIKDVVPKKLQN